MEMISSKQKCCGQIVVFVLIFMLESTKREKECGARDIDAATAAVKLSDEVKHRNVQN